MNRHERTILVTLLDDLRDSRKTAKVPEALDFAIKHVTKKLNRLYREATRPKVVENPKKDIPMV